MADTLEELRKAVADLQARVHVLEEAVKNLRPYDWMEDEPPSVGGDGPPQESS